MTWLLLLCNELKAEDVCRQCHDANPTRRLGSASELGRTQYSQEGSPSGNVQKYGNGLMIHSVSHGVAGGW